MSPVIVADVKSGKLFFRFRVLNHNETTRNGWLREKIYLKIKISGYSNYQFVDLLFLNSILKPICIWVACSPQDRLRSSRFSLTLSTFMRLDNNLQEWTLKSQSKNIKNCSHHWKVLGHNSDNWTEEGCDRESHEQHVAPEIERCRTPDKLVNFWLTLLWCENFHPGCKLYRNIAHKHSFLCTLSRKIANHCLCFGDRNGQD